MNLCALMIDIQISNHVQKMSRFLTISESQITKSHHKIAMNEISLVQVFFPNGQVRQGNGKIINLSLIKQVFFSMADKFVKAAASF